MSIVAYAIGAVVVLLVLFVLFAWAGARAVAERAAAAGRRVVRVRPRWVRNIFVSGLTPFAIVYRVTAESEGRSTSRLYAFDPGQWFSRHNQPVRMFSGGVWRDA